MKELSEKNKKLQKATVKSSEEVRARVEKLVQKKIDPIYREIAGKIEPALKDSKYVPWMLERFLPLEQAKVVIALPDTFRKESDGRLEVSEEFAKKVGVDKNTINKYMQALFEKGFIFPTRKGPQIPRFISQWFDTQNNVKYDESVGKEFFELCRAYSEDEIEKNKLKKIAAGGVPSMRITPRWKAIKDIPGVLPVEDVREIFKAHQIIGLVHCACKKRYPERECKVPDEVCFVTGRTAEYNIERGAAKRVSLKEALDLLDELEKYPLVHTVGYSAKKPEDVGLFCNCHWDCCGSLRIAFLPDAKVTLEQAEGKSRFAATVDASKCIGCKTCVNERCQFGAAQIKNYPEYGGERAYVDAELCTGCGSCVETCPVGARSLKIVRPPEFILEREIKAAYE
ncbi:MAG: 4Fe-4S binding protein [Dehalococcoidales bacterium]|nr:4Fe-4S binding protein [Dehalococcoidales bacterium]